MGRVNWNFLKAGNENLFFWAAFLPSNCFFSMCFCMSNNSLRCAEADEKVTMLKIKNTFFIQQGFATSKVQLFFHLLPGINQAICRSIMIGDKGIRLQLG